MGVVIGLRIFQRLGLRIWAWVAELEPFGAGPSEAVPIPTCVWDPLGMSLGMQSEHS